MKSMCDLPLSSREKYSLKKSNTVSVLKSGGVCGVTRDGEGPIVLSNLGL